MKKKNLLNILLLILMTIAVLYFSLKDNYDEIIKSLENSNHIWTIIAIFIFYLSIYFRSISLKKIINIFDNNFSIYETFRLQSIMQFFNGVTPFASGGQPFQIVWLNKKGFKAHQSMNIITMDFITYQTALVLLGIYAVIFNNLTNLFPQNSILKDLVTLGFFINTVVIILLYLIAFSNKFNKKITNFAIYLLNKFKIVKNKEKTIEKWEEGIDKFSHGAKALFKNKKLYILAIFYNLLGLVLLYLIPYILMLALGHPGYFNINQSIISSAYSMIIGAFVPIPGSTGGLEYAFTQFYGYFIKSTSLITALMILWRTITYYLPMIIGAISLYAKKDNK